MKSLIIIVSLTLLVTAPGCKKKVTLMYDEYSGQQDRDLENENFKVIGYLDQPAPVAASQSVQMNKAKSMKVQMRQRSVKSINHPQKPTKAALTQAQGPARRHITYDGTIKTLSSQSDSLIDLAARLTESVQGYIENRSNNSITLRIPSAQFDVVFDSLMKMGQIIEFRKSAEDISDAFRDTEMRLEILNKTIGRYVKLISLVKEDTEKLQLLKEIERLREELEILEVQKKILTRRAEYGTINFTVQNRGTSIKISNRSEASGFSWINKLDPFTTQRLGKQLKLDVPEGMVRVKGVRFWSAESPGGTKVWTARIPNYPKGSSRFWIDAIRFRIEGQYKETETSNIDDYEFIRFKPYPGSNYIYTVGLTTINDEIHLLQFYFPDQNQEQRYLDPIKMVITRGGKS